MEVRVLSRAPGRLAQLVRASRLHREGQRFESFIAHQKITFSREYSRRGSSVVEQMPEEHRVVSSILTRGTMRLWFNGRTLPCQGRDRGSIPLSRSKQKIPTCSGSFAWKVS